MCRNLIKMLIVVSLAFHACNVITSSNRRDSINKFVQQPSDSNDEIRRIHDFDGIFNDKEENTLDSLLVLLESKTGFWTSLVTIDSTMALCDSIDQFTLYFGQRESRQYKEPANGIAIGISTYCKKIRIETSRNVSPLMPDATAQTIIDSNFIPYFKSGEFFKGTLNGILSMIRQLEK